MVDDISFQESHISEGLPGGEGEEIPKGEVLMKLKRGEEEQMVKDAQLDEEDQILKEELHI
jgi:hypothetical protein